MTRDDIIHMAQEAGFAYFTPVENMNRFKKFSELVAAADRNECAKQRGTLLFNPYNGKPRHPSDIASDPHGILMVEPDALTRAAKKVEPTDWAAS